MMTIAGIRNSFREEEQGKNGDCNEKNDDIQLHG